MLERILPLDACVLINLYATARFAEIAQANGVQFAAVREVASETFFVGGAAERDRTPADLSALIATGDLTVLDMTEEEQSTFIELVVDLDDGEAATLAVAVHRQLPVATDDRKALRVIKQRPLQLTVVTTSELLRHWADAGTVSGEEVAETLRRIETLASFVPGPRDPHDRWWIGAIKRSQAAH